MTKVTILGDTTRAWLANANTVTVRDLTAVQEQFGGKLNIIHTNEGQIAIFPSQDGCRKTFDSFMESNGAFTMRPIQINKI